MDCLLGFRFCYLFIVLCLFVRSFVSSMYLIVSFCYIFCSSFLFLTLLIHSFILEFVHSFHKSVSDVYDVDFILL